MVQPCKDCKAICSLNIEDILSTDKRRKSTQPDILRELQEHGHPRSRNMNGKRQRNTAEAAEELASHYEYYHNKKRPRIP